MGHSLADASPSPPKKPTGCSQERSPTPFLLRRPNSSVGFSVLDHLGSPTNMKGAQ
jgi:hypothetical protein